MRTCKLLAPVPRVPLCPFFPRLRPCLCRLCPVCRCVVRPRASNSSSLFDVHDPESGVQEQLREQRSCSRALLAGCGMPEIASREQCQKLNQLLLSTRE